MLLRREIERMAADHGVPVAVRTHPQNLVLSPPALLELVERAGATLVGAEMAVAIGHEDVSLGRIEGVEVAAATLEEAAAALR